MKIMFLAAALALTALAQGVETKLYRTEEGGEMREVVSNFWSPHAIPRAHLVDLDAAKEGHDFLGLGVSFPESSVYLLSRLPEEKRRAIMKMIWTDEGAGLSIGRLHCGSTDYSMHVYSYNDTPGDTEMKNFSIDEDRKYILPMVKEARTVNKDILFFSSVWSPPAWMKDNNSFGGGKMLDSAFDAYANYIVKYIEAYGKEGIDIKAFTIQNEPETDQGELSPTCLWTAEQECRMITDVLPAKLAAANITAKPWLFDHNFDYTARVARCVGDAKVRERIGAIAWHPYTGTPDMIAPLHRQYPNVPMIVTEMGPNIDKTLRPMLWWIELMFGSFNNGCGGFVSWCMLLDENGQPNISRGFGCGGFGCGGFVELDSVTGEATPSGQFKAFRHVGPFVKRGAKVLSGAFKPGAEKDARLLVCAFRNPDGSHVVVLGNKGLKSQKTVTPAVQCLIKLNDRYLNVQVLPNAVSTVVIASPGK